MNISTETMAARAHKSDLDLPLAFKETFTIGEPGGQAVELYLIKYLINYLNKIILLQN